MDRIHSLTSRIDIQLESELEADRGRTERYTTAVGRLTLARPRKVYLQIQAPVVKTNFAEFASDGSRFQLVVYPEPYRVMLIGSNDRKYTARSEAAARDERLRMAGALANIRPQHFAETILIDPILDDGQSEAIILEESRQVEEAVPPGGSRRERLIRSYYILSDMKREAPGPWSLKARCWFDRNNGLMLVRRQVYEEGGLLVQDIQYASYFRENHSGLLIPGSISFSRPYDQYSAHLILNSSTVALNSDLPETAFVLSKPTDWGDDVQVIDLDHPAR